MAEDYAGLIPPGLAAAVGRHLPDPGMESGADWLLRLPRLIAECLERWELRRENLVRYGMCAVVLAVRTPQQVPAMLKITWPHTEAVAEHLVLRAWNGEGAVRLLAADPSRWALLLERLDPDRDLRGEPIAQACTTIGSLLRQLDRPALPQLARLSEDSAALIPRLAAMPEAIPRRFIQAAIGLLGDIGSDPGADDRLVHTDLHFENVLAATRQPWLAIDPKPLAARPEYAVAPVLWNRWEEVVASGNVRAELRRRVRTVCDAAGLDQDLARAWSVVRLAQNALWSVESPGPDQADELTSAVSIIKAMLD